MINATRGDSVGSRLYLGKLRGSQNLRATTIKLRPTVKLSYKGAIIRALLLSGTSRSSDLSS